MTGKKLILDQTLTDIADAIRAKTGDEDLITPPEMPERIKNIPAGGEAPVMLLLDDSPTIAKYVILKSGEGAVVKGMERMFQPYSGAESIDMSEFDASSVGNLMYLFGNCQKLTSISYPKTGFPSAVTVYGMFSGCSSLENIDLQCLSGAKIGNITSMFQGCSSLKYVSLAELDLTACAEAIQTFSGCSALETVDMSGVDMSIINIDTRVRNTFANCTALENIYTDSNTKLPAVSMYMTFNSAPALSVQSMRNIFNALPTVNNETIRLHATAYNRLSADDIAIATAKGWTVTS